MPFIFPHSRCCSTVPQLSSSISCPKFIYFLLVQLPPSPAGAISVTGFAFPLYRSVGMCSWGWFSLIPSRCCLDWPVLQEFWHGPSLLPCRIEPSFFPGSSCHLHQKVNLFLFSITAFITWKWLLWKILIKHWLFPGWTETEHFSYSIAQDFVLCAAALGSVCMGVCVHMFCGGAVHSGCCCLCFTLQHFQQQLFCSWMWLPPSQSRFSAAFSPG